MAKFGVGGTSVNGLPQAKFNFQKTHAPFVLSHSNSIWTIALITTNIVIFAAFHWSLSGGCSKACLQPILEE